MREDALPPSWITIELGDICQIHDSRRIPINASERNKRIAGKSDSELFPYYGATGAVGKIDGYLFDGEYVLIGEDGAPFLEPHRGVSYLVNEKFWVNNHAHILEHPTSNRFLCYYLRQIDYRPFVTGTTRLKLNQAQLRKIPLPLPPLAEQKRIVAKIEELFSELEAGEESLRTARRQLATYRQSLLKQAFQGHLTAQWREQNNAPPARETILGQLVDIKSGNGFPKHLQGLEDGDYPFFKVGDISRNAQAGRRKLDRADNYVSKETAKKIRGTIIPPAATVFAKIGAAVALNRRGLTSEHCLIDNNTMALIPGDKLDPEFLFLFMRQVDLGKKTRGGAVPSLRKGDIEEIPIALPSLPEQREIVRLLDEQFEAIGRNEREIDVALQRSEALRQSILHRAFTGRLVPQDPADEPASQLLARLRAIKSNALATKSTVKTLKRRRKSR